VMLSFMLFDPEEVACWTLAFGLRSSF